MKVAFVSECYLPTRNGVVSSVETFRKQLVAMGHQVQILAPAYPGYNHNAPYVHRFPSLSFYAYHDYPIAIPYSPRLQREFQRFAPDIVHTQSVFWLTRFGAYWAHQRNIPLVLTFHTLLMEYLHYSPLPRSFSSWIVARLIHEYCNWCDLIIVPTPAIVPLLRSYGVKTAIEPLPTGVEVSELSGGDRWAIRRCFAIPQDASVLLYVGRIALEKNIDFLLQACSRVLIRHPNAYLLLVGSGPYRQSAEAKAKRLPVSQRIIFAGSYPKESMKHFYTAADMFVFASKTETQGLSIVEAMAAGLPCVAVAAHGVLCVVRSGQDGFLVPDDEEEFARAIERLLTNQQLRRHISVQARQRAEQCFSATDTTRQLVSLYERVQEERLRGGGPIYRPLTPFGGSVERFPR